MTADLHLGPPARALALPSDDRGALMVAEPRRPGPDDLVLALDVGGTKLATGVVAGDGRVLAQLTIEARKWEGPEPMIERLIALGRDAVDAAGVEWADIGPIGIACGGPLDPLSGVIIAPTNLPGWIDIPLGRTVSEAFERPVAVDNDATACAIAEWWFGAGRTRNVTSLVYLTISTGIGGGLILDGRPFRGTAGNAGELGHLTIDYLGRECPCGRRGCLEANASGTNIARRAREALQAPGDGKSSTLSAIEDVTARDVAVAAAAGDALAGRIWDETTAMLASGVANILDVFNPELIVLGGGVTNAGDQLLQPVREQALAWAMAPMRGAEIVLAELGSRLGVISAAVIAFERFFEAGPIVEPRAARSPGTLPAMAAPAARTPDTTVATRP